MRIPGHGLGTRVTMTPRVNAVFCPRAVTVSRVGNGVSVLRQFGAGLRVRFLAEPTPERAVYETRTVAGANDRSPALTRQRDLLVRCPIFGSALAATAYRNGSVRQARRDEWGCVIA